MASFKATKKALKAQHPPGKVAVRRAGGRSVIVAAKGKPGQPGKRAYKQTNLRVRKAR